MNIVLKDTRIEIARWLSLADRIPANGVSEDDWNFMIRTADNSLNYKDKLRWYNLVGDGSIPLKMKKTMLRDRTDITVAWVRDTFDYDSDTGELWYTKFATKKTAIGSPIKSIQTAGYLYTSECSVSTKKRITLLVHRLVWMWCNGEIPEGYLVDHINGDRKDNRLCNLRLATRAENGANRPATHLNTSGYKSISVTPEYKNGKPAKRYWRVAFRYDGSEYIKYFSFTDEGLDKAVEWRDYMFATVLNGFDNKSTTPRTSSTGEKYIYIQNPDPNDLRYFINVRNIFRASARSLEEAKMKRDNFLLCLDKDE